MIWKPKPGQHVHLNYKNKAMRHQVKNGTVAICTVGRGGPVNALVHLDDGTMIIIPRGQLNITEEKNDPSTIA